MKSPYKTSFQAEVAIILGSVAACVAGLALLGFFVFRPDAVQYTCPAEELGHILVSSTYDGKAVMCSYMRTHQDYGRAKTIKPALELR